MNLSPFKVGNWTVDPAANEVRDAAVSLRIEPKAMQVLMALAGSPGEVVGRDRLLEAVWPGVVVGDEVLTQTIIKLRKALGDRSRAPSYIETISKRGYRLVAPVERAGDAQMVAAGSHAGPRRTTWSSRRPAILAAAAVLIVAAGVAAYWTQSNQGAPVDMSAVDALQSAPITVTVMPFESLGAGGEASYLARGVSSDLMTDLSRLSTLRLINPSADASTATSAARARYVVLGSVQRDAEQLRVNVRLVDSESGHQLWSQRFERPFSDLFAIQDEIVRRLVELLPPRLGDAERQRLATRYTRNLEAYDCFLQAQALFLVRQAKVNEEARALYQKALALDPKFARAYAGLAMTYAMDYRLQPASGAASTALVRAFELAESARLIDPDIPEVYWALGFVHVQSRRHDLAVEALHKAIELNRSYADAYAFLGGIHTYRGDSVKSIPLLRTALRLNPDGGYLYYMILGRAYFYQRDLQQAIINLREASARNPSDVETRVHLAAALIEAGDRAAGEWEAVEIRALAPHFSMQSWLQTYPMSDAGYAKRLTEPLVQAGL